MELNNIAIFGWIEGPNIKMRIGCRTHMAEALAVAADRGVGLYCSASGCPLGQWADESEMLKEVDELPKKMRVVHFDPPRKAT